MNQKYKSKSNHMEITYKMSREEYKLKGSTRNIYILNKFELLQEKR